MKSRTVVAILLSLGLLFSLCAFAQNAPAKSQAPAKGTSSKTTAKAQTPPQPGMVWANEKSKVYHKEGDRWYGKSKNGKWMTEADAKKAGYREAAQGAAKPKSTTAKK